MKKHNERLKLYPRETETVSIRIPKETMASLRQVATLRDMSEYALLKFYIGQGLRQDLARLHSERVLETTVQILSQHLDSQEKVSAILHEIRTAAVS